MAKLNYPPKPWSEGQRASLLDGMDFMYSQSLKKWVPITPGAVSSAQLEVAFEVRTVQELVTKFDEVTEVQEKLDSEIAQSGRIWKTENRPTTPNKNDIWYDEIEGKTYSYIAATDTWVEINYR